MPKKPAPKNTKDQKKDLSAEARASLFAQDNGRPAQPGDPVMALGLGAGNFGEYIQQIRGNNLKKKAND